MLVVVIESLGDLCAATMRALHREYRLGSSSSSTTLAAISIARFIIKKKFMSRDASHMRSDNKSVTK